MFTKSVQQRSTFIMALLVFFSTLSFAAKSPDKTTEKMREIVQNASPDDWQTLAKCAEKCFNKHVNIKEANEWLDKSIKIAETPYNLSLKGDYYVMNNLPDQALEYYVKAISVANQNHTDVSEIEEIQKKISKITGIGG